MNDPAFTDYNGGAWMAHAALEKLPEANIQAEFYHCCRVLDINCVLEFTTGCGRHDVLILHPESVSITAIVECKSGTILNPMSRQSYRYKLLGVPLFTLYSMSDALPLALKIRDTEFKITVDLEASRDMFRKARRRRKAKGEFNPDDLDECMNYRP